MTDQRTPEPCRTPKTRYTSKPHRRNDELLKGAFEENFQDFLRFLYPDADRVFDFDRGFEFMDKELLEIVPNRDKKKGKRVAGVATFDWRLFG